MSQKNGGEEGRCQYAPVGKAGVDIDRRTSTAGLTTEALT